MRIISSVPQILPQTAPDVIEIFDGELLLGRLIYTEMSENQKGYCFIPLRSYVGGKNTLRNIADIAEVANRLRGTDY